jgi:uncharacterized membrane protein
MRILWRTFTGLPVSMAFPAVAQAQMMGGGMMGGGFMGMLVMLLFAVLLVVLIVWIIKQIRKP